MDWLKYLKNIREKKTMYRKQSPYKNKKIELYKMYNTNQQKQNKRDGSQWKKNKFLFLIKNNNTLICILTNSTQLPHRNDRNSAQDPMNNMYSNYNSDK